MKRIKIVELAYPTSCRYCDAEGNSIIISGTNWEEVSDEEYNLLKKWLDTSRYLLLLEVTNVQPFIKDFIEKAKEKEERALKIANRDKKRQATLDKKKKERELIKLENLAKKFGKKVV